MITNQIIIKIIGEIIDLLEQNGIKIDSPYDLENFAEDYLCDHSFIFATKRFDDPDEDRY